MAAHAGTPRKAPRAPADTGNRCLTPFLPPVEEHVEEHELEERQMFLRLWNFAAPPVPGSPSERLARAGVHAAQTTPGKTGQGTVLEPSPKR